MAGIDHLLGIMKGAQNHTILHAGSGINSQFVAGKSGEPALGSIGVEEVGDVNAVAAHIVHAVAVSGEGAVLDERQGLPKNGDCPVVGEGPFAGGLGHQVFAGVGDVPDEEAVEDLGRAAGEQVDGWPGALGLVVQKPATGDEHRGVTESLLLHGNARAARPGENVFDGAFNEPRGRTPEDLHRPAVGVEEVVLQDGPVGFQRRCPFLGQEGVGSGEREATRAGLGEAAVSVDRAGGGAGADGQRAADGGEGDGPGVGQRAKGLVAAEVEGRADDTPEVIRRRLEVYDSQTAPLIDVYAARGLVAMIDGLGDISEVTARIIEALEARGLLADA